MGRVPQRLSGALRFATELCAAGTEGARPWGEHYGGREAGEGVASRALYQWASPSQVTVPVCKLRSFN